jgi:hypothetical protein
LTKIYAVAQKKADTSSAAVPAVFAFVMDVHHLTGI